MPFTGSLPSSSPAPGALRHTQHAPLVSRIVATRDRVDSLRLCLDGLLQSTHYARLKVIVLNNDSREKETPCSMQALCSTRKPSRSTLARAWGDKRWAIGALRLVHNVAAVTAACLVTRKVLFKETGGFDARNLPVAFNDVDFCLRLRERGYAIVWTPFAELYHLESASRGSDRSRTELKRLATEVGYMQR
jgi:hypothetical protein